MRLYTDMTKSNFSASSVVVSSMFVINVVNDAQVLNPTCVT